MTKVGTGVGAAVALLLAACGGPELDDLRQSRVDTGLRVLLVGVDGATWSVLDPLLAEGRLPVLAEGLARGARGTLASEEPMTSPALWTTIATGRPRSEHGIEGFLVDGRLARSTDRRAPAVWTAADAFGLSSTVVGWWASWPAERVLGHVVSDRAVRTRWVEWTDGAPNAARTSPPELFDELGPLVVDPLAPPMEELDALVDWTAEERAAFLELERPLYANGWSALKFAYAGQRSLERMMLALRERERSRFSALFLVATDPVSHTFWHHREPRHFEGADWDTAERLGGVIEALYEHDDRLLGRLLATAGEDTVVMVVSDHGFRASGQLPGEFVAEDLASGARSAVTVGQSGVHDEAGVIAMWGGPVRGPIELEGATLYDVAPTVLALLGLPVPEDLPGRVLREAVAREFWEAHPVVRVPSFDGLLPEPRFEEIGDAPDPDAEKLEELEALGYFGHPEEDATER